MTSPSDQRSDGRASNGAAAASLGFAAGVGFAVLVMIPWILWDSAKSPTEPGRGDGVAPGTEAVAGGGDHAGTAGVEMGGRRRPFQRSEGVMVSVERPAWSSRIRTNGTVVLERVLADPAALRDLSRHDRLRTLLTSPARDTPECAAVIAFGERKGLPLAATPDLYNILWSTREFERRMAELESPQDRDPLEVIRNLELSDFQRRFQEDFGVDVAPILEELFRLPIQPSVFFGVPQRGSVEGEILLAE